MAFMVLFSRGEKVGRLVSAAEVGKRLFALHGQEVVRLSLANPVARGVPGRCSGFR
jgi:hypothetical protein